MTLWGIIKGLLVQETDDRTKQLSIEVDPGTTSGKKMTLTSAHTDDRTVNLPDATDTLVGKETTDLLKNKQLEDSSTEIVDSVDNTKKVVIDASGTTGTKTTLLSSQTTDKTITLPDATDTLVGKATTDTLTNKTIGDDLEVQGTTTSTSKDTGALVVQGGVGIEENLNVGGDTILTGDLTVNGTTTHVNSTNLDVTDKNITVNKDGNDASSEGAGLTVDRTGTNGSLVYEDALTSKFKLGALGAEVEVADLSSSQTLTNKTIDGDLNTLSDVSITSLKTELADASKFIERDGSGAVVSGKAVPTGDMVGTSDAQTLTNKTIDADNNTISNLAHGAEVDNPSSGVHGVTGSVVGTTDTQQLTNKDIDGLTASNTNRITLPKNTTANLDALTDKEGTVAYDTTLGSLVVNDGATWSEVSGSGGSSYKLLNGGELTYNSYDGDFSLIDNAIVDNTGSGFINTDIELEAQSFTTVGTESITNVKLKLGDGGGATPAGSFQVNIYADNAGDPNYGAGALATGSAVNMNLVTTTAGTVIDFPVSFTPAAATVYWLVLVPTFTSGGYTVKGITSSSYSGGVRSSSPDTGTTWFPVPASDYYFVIQGASTLSFTEDMNVEAPGLDYPDNVIPTSESPIEFLNDGEVAYVTPNTTTGGGNLTVTVDTPDNVPETGYIIARKLSGDLIVGDTIKMKPSQTSELYYRGTFPGYIGTEGEEYSLTIGGSTTAPTKGTTTTDKAIWYRDGDRMIITYNYVQTTSGTAGSGFYKFPLPSGYTIDSEKALTSNNNASAVGTATLYNGGNTATGVVSIVDSSNLIVTISNDTLAPSQMGSSFFQLSGATVNLGFTASVPIEGWVASNLVSTTEDLFSTIDVTADGNAGTALTANVTDIDFTEVTDDTNSWSGTVFTAPRTGKYSFKGQIEYTAATNIVLFAFVNGVSDKLIGMSASQSRAPFDLEIKLNAGDTLSMRVNVGVTLSNIAGRHWLSISSIEDKTVYGVHGETDLVEASSGSIPFPVTENFWGNVTSIELTPGEWDLQIQTVYYSGAGLTTGEIAIGASSTSGNVSPGTVGVDYTLVEVNTTADRYTPGHFFKNGIVISDTTTYYLKAIAVTSINNLTIAYKISARKMK